MYIFINEIIKVLIVALYYPIAKLIVLTVRVFVVLRELYKLTLTLKNWLDCACVISMYW